MGRVTFRIPDDLLTELRSSAARNGVTVNAEVIFRLRQIDSKVTSIRQQSDSNLTADIKVTAIRQQSDSKVTPPVEEEVEGPVLGWKERASAVDLLPSGGDKLRPASDFQNRRRKQVELLQEAWLALDISTTPLTREGAIRFLLAAEDYCEVVIAVFEYANAGGKSGPGMQTYVGKCIPDYLKRYKEELNKKLGGKHHLTSEELAELEWAKQVAIASGDWTPDDAAWAEE